MLLGNTHQLLGGRDNVNLFPRQIRGGLRIPFPAFGGAGQDAGTHPQIGEALVCRKVDEGRPLIKDALGGELLLPQEIKRRCDRFLKLNSHAGPLAEVRHHVKEAAHTISRFRAQHEVIGEASRRRPQA